MGAAATRTLERARDERSAQSGHRAGRGGGAPVLAKRANDRWDNAAAYKFHPMAPGVYAEFNEHSGTPQGFVFGAGWAVAEPFALKSPAQFRSPPPPAITSAEYTRAFDEVRTVGRFKSRTRTADQTHLAFWWKEFAEASHNRLARQLVLDEQHGPLDAGAAVRPAQCQHHGWIHRRLRQQVLLQPLASLHRDPLGRSRWQSAHARGTRLEQHAPPHLRVSRPIRPRTARPAPPP